MDDDRKVSKFSFIDFFNHMVNISQMMLLFCLHADVLDSMARFSIQGVFNYSMLTLSDHERVLYVGAREALFALDPNNISRQLRPQVQAAGALVFTTQIKMYQ